MTTMRVVGECFFWYRLTRVFPDKFHTAVKWLCVCVCLLRLYLESVLLIAMLLMQWNVAHPGSPGQSPGGRKMVVVIV